MNLTHFGVGEGQNRRKTLVILGAGATRGASFVTDRSGPLPPLDVDFFQQLSRLRKTDATERLLAFVRAEFGSEVRLSMEQFFSEADYTDRFHRDFNVDRGPAVKRYGKALGDFLVALPHLLSKTAWGSCVYHDRLASLLHVDDTVLTFNYDLVMDRALRDRAGKRWDPDKQAYGFQPETGAGLWCDHSTGRAPKRTIQLLKMHGSANWRRTATGIALTEGAASGDSLSGVIIPPTWFKSLEETPYLDIWRQARKEVRAARIIVVVGYSVPPTDLFSRSLLKVEAGSKEKREKLDLLVLVNPDQTARSAFAELVRGGLEPSTRILEFDYLSELYELLQREAPLTSRPAVTPPTAEAALLNEVAESILGKLTAREAKVVRLLEGWSGERAHTMMEVGAMLGLEEAELATIYDAAHDKLSMIVGNVGSA